MRAIGHGLRFARAVSAAAKAESAAGGTVAARSAAFWTMASGEARGPHGGSMEPR